MKIAIIDCWSDAVCKISNVVSELWAENDVILMKDLCDNEWLCKHDLSGYSGIIISGSPITLTVENRDKYLRMFPFIKTMELPVFWICFGHQVIAHTFWAWYCNWEFIKWYFPVNLLEKDNHLFAWTTERVFKQNHEQHVEVPAGFRLIANSDTCKNEAMEHISDQIHSVQFHPESSWEDGKMVINNFLKLCK